LAEKSRIEDDKKQFENTFTRFDTMHERDGQTDRHPDRQTDTARRHRPAALTARYAAVAILALWRWLFEEFLHEHLGRKRHCSESF